MKKLSKKIFVFILTFSVILTMLPIASFASDNNFKHDVLNEDIVDGEVLLESNGGISSITISNYSIVEGTNGYWDDYGWDETTQQWEGRYWHYHVNPETITINYEDGSTFTGSEGEIYNQTGYWPQMSYTQDENNQWTAGNSYTVTATFMGATTTFQVSITESPIASISINSYSVTEQTNGYWQDCGWDETTQQWEGQYWYYSVNPESITINYKDGSTFTGSEGEIYNQTGYWPQMSYTQDENNQWTAGNSYTVTATFMGASTTFQVSITESPIASIVVNDYSLAEGTNGYWQGYGWDETTQQWENQYWYYSVNPETITVNYKDGSTVTGNQQEIYNQTGYFPQINYTQDENNQWTAGNSYTVTATFMGASTTFQVSITESPIAGIVVNDYSLAEGTNGYWQGYGWDETTQQWENQYWYYSVNPETITVNYTDGSTFTGSRWEILNQTGYQVDFSYTQDENNQWTAGNSYTVTATFMRVTTTFQVSIMESPIASITVEDVTLREGVDGYWTDQSLPGQLNQQSWFIYNVQPEITIHYKDGTTYTGSQSEIERQTGVYPSVSYTQNSENLWTAGHTYPVTVTYINKSTTYNITIEESPIASISVEPVTKYYGGASVCIESISVTLKDGTIINTIGTKVVINGISYSYEMSYDTTTLIKDWAVGEVHTCTLKIGGKSTTFTCTVVDSPINSISIDDITILKNANQTRYARYPQYANVTLNDGREMMVECDSLYVQVDGQSLIVTYEDGQDEQPWDVGTHSVKATVGGVSTYYNVEVVDAINNISFEPVIMYNNMTGGGLTYNLKYTIEFNDGTTQQYRGMGFKYKGYYYYFTTNNYNDFPLGVSTQEVYLLGKTYNVNVTVRDNVESITIAENNGLTITFRDSSGNEKTVKAFFSTPGSDEGDQHICTEEGYFSAKLKYGADITSNVSIEINGIESNTLTTCNWFKAVQNAYGTRSEGVISKMTERVDDLRQLNYSNGNVTDSNIDLIIEYALRYELNQYTVDDILGYYGGKPVLSVDYVKQQVQKVFGIANIDVSMASGYDAEHDYYCSASLYDSFGSDYVVTSVSMDGSNYVYVLTNHDTDETCTLIFNNVGIIQSIIYTDADANHILEHHPRVESTCTVDGNIEYWYCTACDKYFSDAECTTEITQAQTIIPATGHSYTGVTPTWEWTGYTGAKAKFKCNNCDHVEEVTATVTSVVTTPATCTAPGVTTYTATVSFGGTTYTNITTDNTKPVATGHDYTGVTPTWEWTGYTEAKAKFKCNNCDHVEEVTATVTSVVTTPATCTAPGVTTYTATVSFGGTTYTTTKADSTKPVATGHKLEHHARVEATFEKEGNKEYWKCTVCGKFFTDAEGKNEVQWSDLVIPKSEKPDVEEIFDDIPEDSWFADSVAFVYARGIMKGQGGTNDFAPAQSLQRQEFANMLWRLAGEKQTAYEPRFPDVPEDAWFATPIMWAYKNGVITGYASGNFGVGDNVTREQFATMLYRYAKEIVEIEMTGAADISSYPDAGNVSPWALEAMQWAVGNGIITGKQGIYLDPAGNASRCEGAAMIQRFMEKFGL